MGNLRIQFDEKEALRYFGAGRETNKRKSPWIGLSSSSGMRSSPGM